MDKIIPKNREFYIANGFKIKFENFQQSAKIRNYLNFKKVGINNYFISLIYNRKFNIIQLSQS